MSTETSPSNREENSTMDQSEEPEIGRRGQRLELPEDGYEWKKYGQKFIKHIGKFRSYYKCHKANCIAKKKAEWCSSEPNNIRIVYDGAHTHESSTANSTTTSNANQYNLLTQVFGNQSQSTTTHHHDHHHQRQDIDHDQDHEDN